MVPQQGLHSKGGQADWPQMSFHHWLMLHKRLCRDSDVVVPPIALCSMYKARRAHETIQRIMQSCQRSPVPQSPPHPQSPHLRPMRSMLHMPASVPTALTPAGSMATNRAVRLSRNPASSRMAGVKYLQPHAVPVKTYCMLSKLQCACSLRQTP